MATIMKNISEIKQYLYDLNTNKEAYFAKYHLNQFSFKRVMNIFT